MDSSRIRWKLKNAKRPFARWRADAALHIWGLRHSEQYAARLGINIRYNFHTAEKECPWNAGRIGWCAPERSGMPCKRGMMAYGGLPRLDPKELRAFIEQVRWMRVRPLCAMRKLGLVREARPRRRDYTSRDMTSEGARAWPIGRCTSPGTGETAGRVSSGTTSVKSGMHEALTIGALPSSG